MSRNQTSYCVLMVNKKLLTIGFFLVLFFLTAVMTFFTFKFFEYTASSINVNVQWQQWNNEKRKTQEEDTETLYYRILRWMNWTTEIPHAKTIDDKIKFFYQQLHSPGESKYSYNIHINRSNMLQNSYHAIMRSGAVEDLKRPLKVEFEEQVRYNADENLAEEWLWLLSNEISDPKNEFFRYVDEDNYESEINSEFKDLSYFKFIGRMIGTAVYHRIIVNVYLVKPYYLIMLSQPIEMEDVKATDPVYYENLWKADTTILSEYISSEKLEGNESKTQLIREIIQEKYVTSVQNQLSALIEGFAELVPLHLLNIFTADELKHLIGGVQIIDIDDWQNNTEYGTGLDHDSQVVRWFWNMVLQFSNEQRHRLLQFVVGSFTVPANGFKNLLPKFRMELDYDVSNDHTPRAFPCANTIVFPFYSSEDIMKKRLEQAIEDHHFR